jgi:hypothetical protein
MDRVPRIHTSDPAADRAFGVWADALDRTSHVSAVGAVQHKRTRQGISIGYAGDGRRLVRLTGSANPYSGTQVYDTSSGGWADIPNAPTLTNIYELNAQTGLGGKVVEIRPGDVADWRFRYARLGSSSSSCPSGYYAARSTINLSGTLPTFAGGGPFTTSLRWGHDTFGNAGWYGCLQFDMEATSYGVTKVGDCCVCDGTEAGTMAVSWFLSCASSTGTPNLTQHWRIFNCESDTGPFTWAPSVCGAAPFADIPDSTLHSAACGDFGPAGCPTGFTGVLADSLIPDIRSGSTTFSDAPMALGWTPTPIKGTVTISEDTSETSTVCCPVLGPCDCAAAWPATLTLTTAVGVYTLVRSAECNPDTGVFYTTATTVSIPGDSLGRSGITGECSAASGISATFGFRCSPTVGAPQLNAGIGLINCPAGTEPCFLSAFGFGASSTGTVNGNLVSSSLFPLHFVFTWQSVWTPSLAVGCSSMPGIPISGTATITP